MPDAQRLSDEQIREWKDDVGGIVGWARHRIIIFANEALLRGQERDRAQHRQAVTEGERNLAEAAVKTNYDLLQRAEAKIAALADLHYRYSHGELSLTDYNARFDAIVPEPDEA